MLWTILFTGLAWAGDCTESVNSQEIGTLMQDALMGFATMDEEGFYASTSAAEAKLPCLDEVFLPPSAAQLHRLLAIRAFYDGDDGVTRSSFRAALTVEPDYVLSDKIAPEGGKLRRAYEDARTAPVRSSHGFSVARGSTAWVNGSERLSRPAGVPAIVQLDERGTITWTGYVSATDALPGQFSDPVADVVDEEPVESNSGSAARDRARAKAAAKAKAKEAKATSKGEDLAGSPAPKARGGGGDNTMWILAASSAALTVGLATTSMVSRGSFDDDPTQGKMTLTNGTYFGAIGFGVATAAFGGMALMDGGM